MKIATWNVNSIKVRLAHPDLEARYFAFFGATPESWIGRLWPRGRAHENELSTATLEDNFCNRWSGGLNFLQYRHSGSEVSIDPDGNVFPCCIKTRKPLGSLLDERLEDLLELSLPHLPGRLRRLEERMQVLVAEDGFDLECHRLGVQSGCSARSGDPNTFGL